MLVPNEYMGTDDYTDNKNNEESKQTVCICFDNNDSSISSFIDYLRATFNRHGLYELQNESDRFSDLIRVLLVVFSENYKFSVPERIVNPLNSKPLLVVLVLHGVTISSVTQQIAVFEPWPHVLLESAVFLRYFYNDERSESEFIEEIARDVFEKIYPTEEIGIHSRQLYIEKLLCKQSWGLRTLGISGDPGIGKTTLARALFRRMSSGYDASCFFKDFQKEYSENRLGPLSDKYVGETPVEKFDLNHSDSEPSQRRKRVLIVLDDVQNAKDAESFLGGGFGPGSLIIITSRYKHVLEKCHVNEIYELQGLNHQDSIKLFIRSAFGKDVTGKKVLEYSTKEIECANGNPSTIRAHATKREMEHALLNSNSHDVWYSCFEEDDDTQVWYSCCDVELPSFYDVGLVNLMRDFINSTSHVVESVKNRFYIDRSYVMCIVVSWVFALLWNFLGNVESLGFLEQTLIYLVLIYGYLSALLFL